MSIHMIFAAFAVVFVLGLAFGWVAHADYIKRKHERRRGGMIL